ncbi:hypothetical protein BKA70DRAFT_1240149 [Coprinopsis sp. MPI-PUGE-AT-0042]|nr:hypothetical protein BKA70DRAFT_1240149 [Coprinopsis sp. MPI-PUGE-AT-0042]
MPSLGVSAIPDGFQNAEGTLTESTDLTSSPEPSTSNAGYNGHVEDPHRAPVAGPGQGSEPGHNNAGDMVGVSKGMQSDEVGGGDDDGEGEDDSEEEEDHNDDSDGYSGAEDGSSEDGCSESEDEWDDLDDEEVVAFDDMYHDWDS